MAESRVQVAEWQSLPGGGRVAEAILQDADSVMYDADSVMYGAKWRVAESTAQNHN